MRVAWWDYQGTNDISTTCWVIKSKTSAVLSSWFILFYISKSNLVNGIQLLCVLAVGVFTVFFCLFFLLFHKIFIIILVIFIADMIFNANNNQWKCYILYLFCLSTHDLVESCAIFNGILKYNTSFNEQRCPNAMRMKLFLIKLASLFFLFSSVSLHSHALFHIIIRYYWECGMCGVCAYVCMT